MASRRSFTLLLLGGFLLTGCGGSDIDQLVTDLQSGDQQLRREAARQLGELKPPQPEVLVALQNSVKDSDREVRRLSCFALGEIGTADRTILLTALNDDEMSVRLSAAYALLKMDHADPEAAEVLSKAMQAGDGGVIVAVTSSGPQAAWAVPTLTNLLTDSRQGIRRLAAEGLGKIGSAAQSALPKLQRASQDRDDRVREAAAEAIKQIRAGEALQTD